MGTGVGTEIYLWLPPHLHGLGNSARHGSTKRVRASAVINQEAKRNCSARACQSLKTTVILRPDTLKTTRRMTTPRQISMLFQPCPSGGPRLSVEPVLPVAKD